MLVITIQVLKDLSVTQDLVFLDLQVVKDLWVLKALKVQEEAQEPKV
jgi:hypothetical protein